MNRSNEKPKDLKKSIKTLFKELGTFKRLIAIALILATLGSVISIFTPNILSDLTDNISDGITINKKNLSILSTTIKDSLSEEKIKEIMPILYEMDLSKDNINKTLSSDLNDEDKKIFNEFLSSKEKEKMLLNLPDSVLRYILKESNVNNERISVQDKIVFINSVKDKDNFIIPDSISKLLFKDVVIDGVLISVSDQKEVVSLLNTNSTDINELYSIIEKLPENIRKIIEPKIDMIIIKDISITLIALYLISASFNYIQSILMVDVSNNFSKKLRTKISKKINRLPLKYFDITEKGDILSRITNDVDMIAQSMGDSMTSFVSGITLLIGSVIMMFITNNIMAITAIVSSIIGFIFMAKILSKSQKYFDKRQKSLGDINGYIEEIYSGINIVKVYNATDEVDKRFDELNEELYDSNRKSQFLSGLIIPLMGFVGSFGYVAVCIVGAILTMNNIISFGVIVAFIVYVRLFTSPLSQIAQAMTFMQSVAASSERVFEFLDEKEMNSEEDFNKVLTVDSAVGNIEFKNVFFTYEGNERPTIKDFSAKIKRGQKIAIVGPTGAGKTTIVNLLMKFYEIDSGDILIDGISLNKLKRENIHDLFTMVLQESWLFEGTVKENIIYNMKNISDDRLIEVSKYIGLHHFIMTLSNGYNTELSDNESISTGQKQLLTIARGMIKNSPFLILDEATSNVDTRTEEIVQKAMDKLMKGKTSFIIAHRLSTIKNADLILVMKDGNIIEQGKHKELLKKNGFYADLYNSQFEL